MTRVRYLTTMLASTVCVAGGLALSGPAVELAAEESNGEKCYAGLDGFGNIVHNWKGPLSGCIACSPAPLPTHDSNIGDFCGIQHEDCSGPAQPTC
jgi:hypothetical protein